MSRPAVEVPLYTPVSVRSRREREDDLVGERPGTVVSRGDGLDRRASDGEFTDDGRDVGGVITESSATADAEILLGDYVLVLCSLGSYQVAMAVVRTRMLTALPEAALLVIASTTLGPTMEAAGVVRKVPEVGAWTLLPVTSLTAPAPS